MSRFPGPKSRVLLEELTRYVVVESKPFVVDLEHSHGMALVTMDGDELFDWAGYYGSRLLGHNHRGLSEPTTSAGCLSQPITRSPIRTFSVSIVSNITA